MVITLQCTSYSQLGGPMVGASPLWMIVRCLLFDDVPVIYTCRKLRGIDLRDLDLSLRQMAAHLGQDVGTVQRCVSRWLGEKQQTGISARYARRRTSAHTNPQKCNDPFCTASEFGRHIPSLGLQTVSTEGACATLGYYARRLDTGVFY